MSELTPDDRSTELADGDDSHQSPSESSGGLRHVLENFGTPPQTPPKPLIPQRWRTPVFSAMIVVGLIGLALFVWLVVAPAVNSSATRRGAGSSSSSSTSR